MQAPTSIHPAIRRVAERNRLRRAPGREGGVRPATDWTADDLIAWIETEFYIPEMKGTDHPAMPLADYQKAALREAHRRTPDGKFVYDLVLWSDIKKSAKSSIAAAVILFRALNTEYGSFKIVGNDLKQADSRVFYYMKRALELNTTLAKRATIKNYHITLDTHSTIEAVPVDPKGEAGGNDDLIEFTELHAASSKAALAMWTEMTLSPTKRGYSQRWVDTYAGHSGEAPVLEPLYQTCVKDGTRLDLGIDGLEVYANGSAFCLWNTRPRCPWQTSADGQAYYASEARTLVPNEYRRVHENAWVTSADVFVPAEWWDACRAEMPAFDARAKVVIGMDAGVSSDCFALVGVSRIKDLTYVRFTRVWRPQGGKIDFDEVEHVIREELVKQYVVAQIPYDPSQLHQMATRLTKDRVAWLYEFNQGQPRLIADKQLYDCIRDRRIVHDGNSILREHVTNANGESDARDHSLRIVKRAEHLKIDACVALSMANSEARRLMIG